MKLATTTGDFHAYTNDQTVALRHIRDAGFRYADYSFGSDYKCASGVYSENYLAYFDKVAEAADSIGIKLIQAHSPMGKPLADGGRLLGDTLRCVDACGAWGIKNLVVFFICIIEAEHSYPFGFEYFCNFANSFYGFHMLIGV